MNRRWALRADESQASFLCASKVTLGPYSVTCDLVFLSPLLPGRMGRKDTSDLRRRGLGRRGLGRRHLTGQAPQLDPETGEGVVCQILSASPTFIYVH